MAGGKKKVPIGRVKSDDARLVFRTNLNDIDDFIERFSRAAFEWGLIIRNSPDYETGQALQLAIMLESGKPALRARAVVERPERLGDTHMAVRFTAMDSASRGLMQKMLEVKRARKKAATDPTPAAPQAASATQEILGVTPQPSPGEAASPTPQPFVPPPAPPEQSDFTDPVEATRAEQEAEQAEEMAAAPFATPPEPAPEQIRTPAVSMAQAPKAPGFAESLRRMVLVDDDPDIKAALAATAKPDTAEKKGGLVIGIDLGTTNSCCAMVKGDRPFVIPSRRGHNTIPSVVAINAMGDELVGNAAKAQMEINPERTIYGSKRLVGRPFDSPIVQQVRDRFHYKIVEGEDKQAAVLIDDRILTLEDVAARILTEMKDTAQEYLGQIIERAVVTVPAFYNENQRQAVRKAGELAELQVERILNEPTAAALTFGYKNEQNRRILVYDLGGGTFDASVMELKGDVYEVLSTGGDTFLGGVDFDTQLMDHILIEFQLDLGRMPEMDRVAYLRVLQGAEFAKRTLSSKSEVDVKLPFIGRLDGKPVNLDVKVTREIMEDLVRPLVKRTLDTCESVLAERSMKPDLIDDILLVGGQTRMPLVWSMIQDLFGKEPLKGVHPDESVAIGAALLGHSIGTDAAINLVDVLPISIGVGTPGGTFRIVISSGTALPAARTYGLYTYVDNQTTMIIPVYQGESTKVDESELLGTVELVGIPPGPAGSRMLEVTFVLSPECLLSVTAKDRDGEQLAHVEFNTQDNLEAMAAKLAAVPEKAASAPSAAAASASKADQPEAAAVPKKGFFGWLKGLFSKKS